MAEGSQKDFALVGLSHKTAPVSVRERLAIGEAGLSEALAELAALPGVAEAVLVSTCNRVEVYAHGAPGAADAVKGWLVARGGEEAKGSLYARAGAESVLHLFRVSASLDSMVLGEPQILGQIKDAFQAARKAGSVAGALTRACEAAFASAKRARTETAIGSAPVSMASAAVELAKKVFGALEGRTVLLVGAGKMSELTARHLAAGNPKVLVTNRTLARAEHLAQRVGGRARAYEELPALLVEADIVVSSTAAPRPVLTVELVRRALKARHFRPLFLIDLAVPRDVEEGVGKLENVYAYDVDDLDHVIDASHKSRETEARRAEAIVREEVDRFLRSQAVRDGMPVIAALRAKADEIARAEAEKTLAIFGDAITPKQRRSVEAMARAIVNKLLHAPTQKLRDAGRAAADDGPALAAHVAELFELGPAAGTNGAGEAAQAGSPAASEAGGASEDRSAPHGDQPAGGR